MLAGIAVIVASGVVIVMRESAGPTTGVKRVTTARSQRGDTVPGLRVNVLLRRNDD